MEEKNKQLMEQLIEEGKKFIVPEKIENWTKYVNSTKGKIDSLHNISVALGIIALLDNGADMDFIIESFQSKECPIHVTTVRALVANYSLKGPEFFEKTAEGPIPIGNFRYLEKLKKENTKLLFIHNMKDAGYEVEAIPNGPILVTTPEYSCEVTLLTAEESEKMSLELKKD